MQSRFPDINTAFNTHRKQAIIAMDNGKWLKALGALYAINGALPEDYRVIISDQKYQEMTRQDILVTCKKCKGEINYNKIKVLSVLMPAIESLISGNNTEKVWFCPECNEENNLIGTAMKQTILQQPYYLGVIQKPPTRSDGLLSHVNYRKLMERWCHTMLDELEAKMAEYRDDNWKRGDEEEFGTALIDTSWEESDS